MKPTISADGFSTERTSRATARRRIRASLDTMLARGDVVDPAARAGDPHQRRDLDDVLRRRLQPRRQQAAAGRRVPRAGAARREDRARPIRRRRWSTMRTRCWTTHAPGCLYARVDVVVAADRFVLMEVELVEPSLYLEHDPPAAGRLRAGHPAHHVTAYADGRACGGGGPPDFAPFPRDSADSHPAQRLP